MTVVLDVGTTKVLVVAAELSARGARVMGYARVPSRGMRRGAVVDLEEAAAAVSEAVREAEHMVGSPLRRVLLPVGGPHLSSVNHRGVVAVARPEEEISEEDLERVMEAARLVPLARVGEAHEVVEVIPRQYVVDGCEGIRDPLGMMGSRLELEAHVITGVTSFLQNLYRVVERAGLEIEGVCAAIHAAGEAVLTPDEKELGVALVDIGGGTTDLAVYQRGGMIFSRSLPLGGEQITGDLAYGLGTTLAQAEVLKMEYREGLSSPLRVPEVSGQGVKEVPAEMVGEIMRARLREILEIVSGEFQAQGYGSLPGGMVLTGGVAATEGIVSLAREITRGPVRVGWPEEMAGVPDSLLLPQAAVALGGLRLAAAHRRSRPVAARVGRAAWKKIQGFRTWLREVF